MSEERDVTDLKTNSTIALDRSMSKSDLRAKMVEILDRGVTSDRLHLDVDPDIHYEWIPNKTEDINTYKTYGFEVLSRKYVRGGNPLHEQGGDEIIVGDVIAMGCSKARKEVIDEIRLERFTAMHGKPGSNTQKEEGDFSNAARTLKEAGIDHFAESKTESVSGAELEAAIKTK